VANELRKRALTISSVGVRYVWQPHELANMKLRLKALETHPKFKRSLAAAAHEQIPRQNELSKRQLV